MSKTKLAVIFGGKSSEYPVSLHSAGSLIHNIDTSKFEYILIGITREGAWFLYEGGIDEIEHDTWHLHPTCKKVVLSPSNQEGFIVIDQDSLHTIQVDCIFPILHGKNGEDGTIQGLFELANIPYIGPGVLASSASMDKEITHILCEHAGIPMAPYMAVHRLHTQSIESLYKHAVAKLGLPIFIKPANAGSSFGISKIRNVEEFEKGLSFAFEHDDKVLLETTIEGFEVGCAVMGNDILTVGSIDEIDTKNDFFDYEGKYELENTQIICPARIPKEVSDQVKELAKIAFQVMGCVGMARVDFFITPNQKIIFNELNTIPGFTATSRYPNMMKDINIDFKTLITSLVELALNK